jgi:hypothetical protein
MVVFSALKMEAVCSSETSACSQNTTWPNNSEDYRLYFIAFGSGNVTAKSLSPNAIYKTNRSFKSENFK